MVRAQQEKLSVVKTKVLLGVRVQFQQMSWQRLPSYSGEYRRDSFGERLSSISDISSGDAWQEVWLAALGPRSEAKAADSIGIIMDHKCEEP